MEPLNPMKAVLYPDNSHESKSTMHPSTALDVDALIEEDLKGWLEAAGYQVQRIGNQHWSVTRADGCVVSISGLDRLSLYTANAQQMSRLG